MAFVDGYCSFGILTWLLTTSRRFSEAQWIRYFFTTEQRVVPSMIWEYVPFRGLCASPEKMYLRQCAIREDKYHLWMALPQLRTGKGVPSIYIQTYNKDIGKWHAVCPNLQSLPQFAWICAWLATGLSPTSCGNLPIRFAFVCAWQKPILLWMHALSVPHSWFWEAL